MAGLFGAEVTLRRWARDKAFPCHRLDLARAFALILLACFVNPSGVERFYPPFFQDRLESIRAYVGEMEPLPGGAATLVYATSPSARWSSSSRRWFSIAAAFRWQFLVLAIFTLTQAFEIKKAWPVFGLFVPLLVLSSAAFALAPATIRLARRRLRAL